MQYRDASGRFISKETWQLSYALAGKRVPQRVGARNRVAPLTRDEVNKRARRAPIVKVTPQAQRKKLVVKKVSRPGAAPKKPVKVAAPERAYSAGTEFELTAKYRSQRGGRSMLHVKIRVSLNTPMTNDQALAVAERAIRSGQTPSSIDVQWIDWSRGKSGGTIDDPDFIELKRFYRAINASGAMRFAKVADSERDI